MILTGAEILKQRDGGKILIDPFRGENLGPNSYDLTLSDQVLLYSGHLLDMAVDNPVRGRITIPPDGMIFWPNDIYLCCTNECCGSDNFVCCLEGRSSVGRLGIQVHLTAGVSDLGFRDRWTLEMTVVKPVRVYPNVRICQAIFYQTVGEVRSLYKGKYVSQPGPVPSRMWKDREMVKKKAPVIAQDAFTPDE